MFLSRPQPRQLGRDTNEATKASGCVTRLCIELELRSFRYLGPQELNYPNCSDGKAVIFYPILGSASNNLVVIAFYNG